MYFINDIKIYIKFSQRSFSDNFNYCRIDSYASLKREGMARKFPDYKKIITENNVLLYFKDVHKCYNMQVSLSWSYSQKFMQEQRRMNRRNCSSLTKFIFLGITGNTENKVIPFTMFLLVYILNLLANLGMITLIRMDPQLHTPMYFFLSHLSFCDLYSSTAIGPEMLMDLFAKNKSISFHGCALQFLVFCIFADRECLLRAVMAYDWSKTISSPLLYAVSMSTHTQRCVLPAYGLGLPGGNGRCSDTHDISIPLMFLWVKWE